MWIPNQPDEAALDRAQIAQMVMIDEAVRHFTPELKSIDPDLELVKASNDATVIGLKPGYWHILRKGTPCTLLTLEGPAGEFREPGSWMFQWLLEQDMWNDRTQQMKAEQAEKARAAMLRERALEREDRIQELNERWASLNRTSVSMTDFKKGWTGTPGVAQPKKG